MHIPDGFLSTPVWVTMSAAAAPAVGYSIHRARGVLEESRAPLLGVMGAFVFAAQMINFPVGVGASGHLLGAALLAVTVGPAAASIVMTAILGIQALIFQDGGLLAFGANVFNMAVAGVFVAYLPFRLWGGSGAKRSLRRFAVFIGAFLSVAASAALAVTELLLSGTPIPGPMLALSAGLFLVSAAAEGAITLLVFQAIEARSPALILQSEPAERGGMAVVACLAIALALTGVLVASQLPDGLQSLVGQAGVAGRAHALIGSPFANYEVGWLEAEWPRKAAAGIAGVFMILAIGGLFGRLLSNRGSA